MKNYTVRKKKNTKKRKLFNRIVKGGNIEGDELIRKCRVRNFDKVKELVEKGVDVNYKWHENFSVLHAACQGGNYNIIKLILDKGARVTLTDFLASPLNTLCDYGITYLCYFEEYDDDVWNICGDRTLEIVDSLIEKGCDVNNVDAFGRTCLECLINKFQTNLSIELIKRGADVNIRRIDGKTNFYYVIYDYRYQPGYRDHWYPKLLLSLINNGADVNIIDDEQNTPLQIAFQRDNIEIIMALLDRGADVNVSDKEGNTPLHLACEKGNIELVNKIINKGADINTSNGNQYTPLHLACKNGNVELVNKLINKGADVNAEDAFGEIPFHYIDLNDYKEYGLDPQDEKLRSRFYKDGVYELRKFKEIDIPIIVIPRGTLLFRSVQEGIDDFCGIRNGYKYCMNKNYNVFFYPYPAYRRDKFKIFVVEETLKIVNLIYPSYLSREVRLKKKYDFIQSCDEVERDFCGGNNGYRYDPCFSEEFLKENPDIAGMIGLAVGDLEEQKNQYTDLNKYSIFHRDVRGKMGVPELILYPKQTRQISDNYWSGQECFEGMRKGIRNYSYLIDSKNYQENIMESLLNPKGYNIQRIGIQSPFTQTKYDTIHVTLYNPLKMYVVWEYLEENYTKDCVPINWSAKSKLSQFQTDINRSNDGLYDKIFTTFKKFKGMNNIIGRGGKSRNGKTKRNKTRKKSSK